MNRMRTRISPVEVAALAAFCAAPSAIAAPPTPDHIVIVIEENHSLDQVIGSVEAPYINSLAASGMLFTNFYAITHPSQPNYLQLFSGSSQGVTGDGVPSGTPWTTPNLGAEIIAAGRTFAGYSEDLPSIGSNVTTSLAYARKHNPWVNWQTSPTGTNQLLPATNRPFFSPLAQAFFGDCNAPIDYSALPTVTFVVPNLNNDMHDGTIAQADQWLQMWIEPYRVWAQTHNSLLIITWDEDAANQRNRIPTIFNGPMMRQGQNNVMFTLHNLLRTVEEMYGTAHTGSAANVRSIVGAFTNDVSITTRRFQQGVNGYAGARDTYIELASPDAGHGIGTPIVVDGSPLSQGLIRFDDIIGNGVTQVPRGATILSAKLAILTGSVSGDSSLNTMAVHRMIANWSESSTWNSLTGGVSNDDIEAASHPGFTALPNVNDHWVIFDVSNTVQTWVDATDPVTSNCGWAVLPSGTDGWRWVSSDASGRATDHPILEIIYRTPCPADVNHTWDVNIDDLVAVITNWNATGGSAADVNHDDIVNIDDLVAVITSWGLCP